MTTQTTRRPDGTRFVIEYETDEQGIVEICDAYVIRENQTVLDLIEPIKEIELILKRDIKQFFEELVVQQ